MLPRMRLADLNPVFTDLDSRPGCRGYGIELDCPRGAPTCARLHIPFRIALDGFETPLRCPGLGPLWLDFRGADADPEYPAVRYTGLVRIPRRLLLARFHYCWCRCTSVIPP